jgi:hypothetical protein
MVRVLFFSITRKRSDRRRWIHAFESVVFVWYHASLADFDELMYEDGQTNRMEESLLLWTQLATERSLQSKQFRGFFLVLTHADVLRTKLARGAQFKRHVPGYTGDNSYDSVMQHIRDTYLAAASNARGLRTFVVDVRDENDVRTLARAIQHHAAANALAPPPLGSASP